MIDNFLETLSGDKLFLALQQISSPQIASDNNPNFVIVGDPALGMEGFFEDLNQEYPPSILPIPASAGKGKKAIQPLNTAFRSRVALFWQILILEAEPDILFGEGGLQDILPDVLSRFSRYDYLVQKNLDFFLNFILQY